MILDVFDHFQGVEKHQPADTVVPQDPFRDPLADDPFGNSQVVRDARDSG